MIMSRSISCQKKTFLYLTSWLVRTFTFPWLKVWESSMIKLMRSSLEDGTMSSECPSCVDFFSKWIYKQFAFHCIYFRSVIRTSILGKPRAEALTPGIANCNASETFWVRWTGGNVRVGMDLLDTEPFLTWEDPEPHPVNAIAVSSGFGNTGIWQMSSDACECGIVLYLFPLSVFPEVTRTIMIFAVYSTKFVSHEKAADVGYWLRLSSSGGILFQIKSCTGASIFLTEILGELKLSKRVYEIR